MGHQGPGDVVFDKLGGERREEVGNDVKEDQGDIEWNMEHRRGIYGMMSAKMLSTG